MKAKGMTAMLSWDKLFNACPQIFSGLFSILLIFLIVLAYLTGYFNCFRF